MECELRSQKENRRMESKLRRSNIQFLMLVQLNPSPIAKPSAIQITYVHLQHSKTKVQHLSHEQMKDLRLLVVFKLVDVDSFCVG